MSQQRIRILDDATINQIAAGEVVENPATVVKELVENAIDAGATEIVINTLAGGRGLIRIADNGCGMSQDELILSVERHATSKLTQLSELNSLCTLGFRGEALPSIASVSKMALHSSTFSGEGAFLEIEGGKIGTLRPLPRRKGTTIEVKSLFFNTPVRKKFQRSVNSDTGEIHKVLTKFALSYHSTGFSWNHEEKQIFNFLPGNDSEERYKVLLGEEFINNTFHVEHSKNALFLSGRMSCPAYHRPNRSGQYLFINQRAVSCPFIEKKIVEGYGVRLSTHRYPLFVLDMRIPPAWIDVNVHPQKREVRLREEANLSAFILEAMDRAFLPNEAVSISISEDFAPLTVYKHSFSPKEQQSCLNVCEPALEYHLRETKNPDLYPKTATPNCLDIFEPSFTIVAKVRNYFFIEEAKGVRLVDGNRALERIVYEELSEKKSKRAVQTLLIPIHMTVIGKEKALLFEHIQDLNELGISIRHFGGDSFIVDAVAAGLEPDEIPDLIYAYIEEGTVPVHLERCFTRRAISIEAAPSLLKKLFRCQDPLYTPSGKLIHKLLDEKILEKILVNL